MSRLGSLISRPAALFPPWNVSRGWFAFVAWSKRGTSLGTTNERPAVAAPGTTFSTSRNQLSNASCGKGSPNGEPLLLSIPSRALHSAPKSQGCARTHRKIGILRVPARTAADRAHHQSWYVCAAYQLICYAPRLAVSDLPGHA